MTTSAIRVTNLMRLARHYGSLGALGRICQSPAYSRLLSFTNGHEQLDDKAARTLEQNLNLPKGWLGNPDNENLPLPDSLPARDTHTDNSDEIQALRRSNIGRLVGDQHGAKTKFCRRMSWYPREYYRLFSDVFGARRARQIEKHLGLPESWLDMDHSDAVVQEAALNLENRFANSSEEQAGVATPEIVEVPSEAQGPIARALLAKVQKLVMQNRLPEKKAYQLLGELMDFEDD